LPAAAMRPQKNRTVDPFYIMDRIGHRGLMQDL
jgi:hypothetical protein